MIASLVVRFFQLVFGAVVLGISISAAKWQVVGSVPATTGYGAFSGAFAMLAALIGVVVIFIDAIPDLIMAAVDGIAAIFLLAGGIAFAVGLRGANCSSPTEATALNKLLNGGCLTVKGELECAVSSVSQLSGRCREMEADAAFLFLAFLVSVAAAILCFIGSRRGGVKHSSV